MENKSHALAAGVFVLAVTAMLISLAMWLMRDVANTTLYEMTTTEAVTGLQVQAPVRYKGVAVGKVTSIGFDRDAPGNVLVTMAIAPDTPVTASTFATLGFQGVTGLSFVQLDDTGNSDQPLPDGPNGPQRIPLKPNLLGALTDRASDLLEKLSSATDRVEQMLGPDNQAALTTALTEIGAAAKSVQQLAATTDKTLQAQFDPQRGPITGLVQQTRAAMQSVRSAADSTGKMTAAWQQTARDTQQTLSRLSGPGGAVQRIGDSADAIVTGVLPRVEGLADDASRAMHRLQDMAGHLDHNPQSLLYGNGSIPPGPGEPGFQAPAPAAAQQP